MKIKFFWNANFQFWYLKVLTSVQSFHDSFLPYNYAFDLFNNCKLCMSVKIKVYLREVLIFLIKSSFKRSLRWLCKIVDGTQLQLCQHILFCTYSITCVMYSIKCIPLNVHAILVCVCILLVVTLRHYFLIMCLKQSVLLFDKHCVHCPFATVRTFFFILLNSLLLLPMMSFRFQFPRNASIGLFWNIFCNVGQIS